MGKIFRGRYSAGTGRRLAAVYCLSLSSFLAGAWPTAGWSAGFGEAELARQTFAPVAIPGIEEAAGRAAEAAANLARPLLAALVHEGKRLAVPAEYPTIQAALDAADRGDQVVVAPGVYYEQLYLRDGVKLVSASGADGDEPVPVEGAAYLKLPRRALRTVIDGSREEVSSAGMLNFSTSAGRETMVDGFTIQNLPARNHHLPGHAHTVNLRGASPVITNCNVRHNGSTGIGSHVVFRDQDLPFAERDFRRANIQTEAAALIYHNVVGNNLGRGIGANEFSSPLILGNELFANDDVELGDDPGPGIGAKHGANPTIAGNIIHHHPRGGIRIKVGDEQGRVGIDQAPQGEIRANLIYGNGLIKPAITLSGAGSRARPTRIAGNYLYDAGVLAIALEQGAVAIIEDNLIAGGDAGMALADSTVLKLNRNTITRISTTGVRVSGQTEIGEMAGNTFFAVDGQALAKE